MKRWVVTAAAPGAVASRGADDCATARASGTLASESPNPTFPKPHGAGVLLRERKTWEVRGG